METSNEMTLPPPSNTPNDQASSSSEVNPPLNIENQAIRNSNEKLTNESETKTISMNKVKSDLQYIEIELPTENHSNGIENNIDVNLIEIYLKQGLLENGFPLPSTESSLSTLFTCNTHDNESNVVINNNVVSTNEISVHDKTLVNKNNCMVNSSNSDTSVNNLENNIVIEQNSLENVSINSNSNQVIEPNEQISSQNVHIDNTSCNAQNIQSSSLNCNSTSSFQLLHVAYKNPKRIIRKKVKRKKIITTTDKIIETCSNEYDFDLLMKEAGIQHVSDIPLPPTTPPPLNNLKSIIPDTQLEIITIKPTSNVIQNTTSKRKQNLLKDIREEYNVNCKKIKTPYISTKLKPILPRQDGNNSEIQIITPFNGDTDYTVVEIDSCGNVIYLDNNNLSTNNVYTNIIEIDSNPIEIDSNPIEEEINYVDDKNTENSTENEIDLLLNFAEKSSNIITQNNIVIEQPVNEIIEDNTEILEPNKILENIMLRSRNLSENDEDDTADIEINEDSEEELEHSNQIDVSNNVPLVPVINTETLEEDDNISVITLSDNEDEFQLNNFQLSENKENESLIEESSSKNDKTETVEDQLKFFKKFETFFKILKKEKNIKKIEENEIINNNKPCKYTIELMRRFCCPYCTKSFIDLPGALTHGKKIHGENKKKLQFLIEAKEINILRCNECKHIHINHDSFRKHIEKYHPINKDNKPEEQINCNVCNVTFFRKCDLTRHQHREHGSKSSEDLTTTHSLDLLGVGDYSDIIDLDASNDSIGNIQICNFDEADDVLNYHSNPVPHVEDIDAHFEDLFTIIEQPMPID